MTFRRIALPLLACCACASSSPASPSHTTVGTSIPQVPGSGESADAGADAESDAGAAGVAVSFDFDECAPSPLVGDFPDDVGAALRGKCNGCHGQPLRHGAPFPLVNYENVVVTLPKETIPIWQRMSYVIQPGSVPHMPLSGPPLTDAEMQTLDGWFAACAPPVAEGTGADLDSTSVDGGSDVAVASDAAAAGE
jgi:hypothetical protein